MKSWIAGALIAAAPCLALAQDRWEQQVQEQLLAVAYEAGGGGWVLSHDIVQDSMNEGQTEYFDLVLDGGYDYGIVAVCDTDCSDIDLYLHDPNGNEVASDTSTDDFPILDFTPYATGSFSIGVRMYSCSVEPCYYGVAVFTQ